MPALALLSHRQLDITSHMETFATAVSNSLRFVLSRLAIPGGEAFFFSFLDEDDLASGPVTGVSLPIEPALARRALGGVAAPATAAEHVAVIAEVIDHSPVRAEFNIDDGELCPWIIRKFFRALDAADSAGQIGAYAPMPTPLPNALASKRSMKDRTDTL